MEALKNNSQAIVRALTVAVAVILQAITMVLAGISMNMLPGRMYCWKL